MLGRTRVETIEWTGTEVDNMFRADTYLPQTDSPRVHQYNTAPGTPDAVVVLPPLVSGGLVRHGIRQE